MSLLVEDLHAYHGQVHVLHGLSLEVHPGQVVAMLGRNGMGKTTFAHTVMGLLKARRGAISVDDHAITGLPPERVNKRGVALMPQGHRVFSSLTVGENLQVAHRASSSSSAWTIERALERLPLLGDRWSQRSDTLSGGEQQMLTLARALVGNPKYVVLDEPAEGLAPAIVERFAEIIHDLRREGVGVVLIEQRIDYAIALADQICVVSRGTDVFQGSPADFAQQRDLRTQYLGI